MRLITLAALLAVTSTLTACKPEEARHSEAIFAALGAAPLPAGLTDEPAAVETESSAPSVEPVVVTPPPEPEPPKPQYGEPGYVAGYMEKGYTGPEPCPGSIYRVLTCESTETGEWHWLGTYMEWLN